MTAQPNLLTEESPLMAGPSLSIAALGDLSFEGVLADHPSAAPFEDVASRLRRCDLVIANLESPLLRSGHPIPGKCTLRGSPEWAASLRDAGIGLVTLANNHTMDYGTDGLLSTMQALEEAGVRFLGAGLSAEDACAPFVFTVRGTRVACIARTAVEVSAPTYAGDRTPGVAFLDVEETLAALKACRAQAEVVILSVHWGLEEHRYPSPTQRQLAHRFVDAGADLVLGHHPHVTQGIERIGAAVVAYSLGNFFFSDFKWQYEDIDGTLIEVPSPLSVQNRQGLVLEVTCSADGSRAVGLLPTLSDGHGHVRMETAPTRYAEIQALSAALGRPHYRLRWQTHAIRREWSERLVHTLAPARAFRNVHKVRPRHIRGLLTSLQRSARIVSEKSTNPYE